mmetsp:Transcript_36377/g.95903  ORF Transcript_36377/g.95903 Transcript_36377/m.95903 type:complete len:233 (+) Transcript_36377:2230-2928(+)
MEGNCWPPLPPPLLLMAPPTPAGAAFPPPAAPASVPMLPALEPPTPAFPTPRPTNAALAAAPHAPLPPPPVLGGTPADDVEAAAAGAPKPMSALSFSLPHSSATLPTKRPRSSLPACVGGAEEIETAGRGHGASRVRAAGGRRRRSVARAALVAPSTHLVLGMYHVDRSPMRFIELGAQLGIDLYPFYQGVDRHRLAATRGSRSRSTARHRGHRTSDCGTGCRAGHGLAVAA